MKLIQTLLVLAVLVLTMTACKKKMPDTAQVAETFCDCNNGIKAVADEMKAATGNVEKLKKIAGRIDGANTKAVDCFKTTMGKYNQALKSEKFKADVLKIMESSCPQASKILPRLLEKPKSNDGA